MELPPTEETSPLPEDTGRGLTLKYRGRHLLSSRNPEDHCRKILEQFPREESTLYLIVSPLFGHHLASWADSWGTGCHGLVLELEAELKKFIPVLPQDSFTVLQEDSEKEISTFFRIKAPEGFRRVRTVSLSGGSALHTQRYQAVCQRLESEITTYWQNRSTLMVMAPLYLKNLWKNLAHVSRHSSCLPWQGGRGDGRALLVIGAGESLEPLLPRLNRFRDRLFLAAADTALPALKDAGVVPDAVTVLESQYHNLADFTGCAWEKIELWADLTAHPKTFRLPWKSVRYFLSRFDDLGLLDRMETAGIPLLPPRGSVGVTALELSLKHTQGPVGVAGLDFCFIPGKTHVRGAPGHSRRLSTAYRFFSLETPPAEGLFWIRKDEPRLAASQALRQYGQSAAYLAGISSDRVWDLRAWGWDLGIRKATLDGLAGMSKELPAEEKVPLPPRIPEILNKEAALLEELWEDFRIMGAGGTLPPEFVVRLNEAGYLWCAFPDRHRIRLLAPDTLGRIKASLAFHWHHLSAARQG